MSYLTFASGYALGIGTGIVLAVMFGPGWVKSALLDAKRQRDEAEAIHAKATALLQDTRAMLSRINP